MADEARATVGVDADTEGAKSSVKSLGDIFGGLSGSVTGSLFSFNQLAEAANHISDVIRVVSNTIQSVIAGTWNLVKGFADVGDSIFTLGRKTGLGAEALSTFNYIGEQTNTTTEAISGSVFKMGVNIAKGAKQTEAAFQAIGTSGKELKELKPEEQFQKIMLGLQGIPDAGQRAMVGVQIFGKGFQGIAQLVDEDLNQLMKNAKTFGLVMSDEMAAAGDQLNDTLSDLSSMFQGLKNIIGGALLPIVNAFVGTLRDELLAVFGMLKDAFGPLFSGFGGFQKGLVETGQSAEFHTKVLRALVSVIAFLIDAFASLVRAVGVVVASYYEFRTVAALIEAAMAGLVVGIQTGAKFILEALAKITPGDAGKKFQQWANEVNGRLKETQKQFWEAKDKADAFDKASRGVTDSFGGLADKLNAGTKALREAGAEYKGTASKVDPLKTALKGLNDEIDLTPDKLTGLAKKIDDWKTSTHELNQEIELARAAGLSNNEIIEMFGKKAEEAAKWGRIFGKDVPGAVQAVAKALEEKNIGEILKKIADTVEVSGRSIIKSLGEVFEQGAEITKESLAALKTAEEFQAKYTDAVTEGTNRRLIDIEREKKAALDSIQGQGFAFDQQRKAVQDYYDLQKRIALGTYDTIQIRQRAAGVFTRAELQRQVADFKRDYEQMRATGEYTTDQIYAAWSKFYEAEKALRGGWSAEFDKTLAGLVNSFTQLAQIAGGSFGGLAKGIGVALSALQLGSQSAEGFTKTLAGMKAGTIGTAAGAAQMAGNVVGMVGAMQEATSHGSATANVLGGMVTGMKMGAMIAGPWGAAVGAAVGAIWGAVKGKPEWAKIQSDLQRDFGSAVSDTLAKEIEKTSKEIGDRGTAIMLHLSKVLEETGGITAANVEKSTAKVRDLFVYVGRGQLSIAQANEQLSATFPKLVQASLSSNGLIGKSVLELIHLNDQYKLQNQEITNLIQKNITGQVIPGLNAWATVHANAAAAQKKQSEDLTALEGKLAEARTDKEREEIGKQIADLKKAGLANESVYKATSITSEGAALGLSAAVVASFNKLRDQGMSVVDVLAQLKPTIDDLGSQMDALGFSGSDAFREIRDLSREAADSVTAQGLTAIDGLTAAMKGLHNSGMLDQEMFSGLSSQIASTFNGLVAQGKDGNTIMKLMRPTLQTLWEEQQKFGFTTDEATQALLDQAVASGQVGEKYMSAQDRMAKSTERVVTVLEAMAEKMGVTLPKAADQMASRIGGSVDRVGRELNGTPWDQWATDAEDAASRAKDAVESVAGNSPSGIELIAARFVTATQAAKSFTKQVVDQMQEAKSVIESVSMSKSDPSLETFTGSIGHGGGGAALPVTHGVPIMGGDEINLTMKIEALDSASVETFLEKKGLPALVAVLGKGGKNLSNLKHRIQT